MIDNIANKHNTRIGVIGLGLMGSRFLRRLNSQGWKVRGWNRSRAATLPLKKYGFAIIDTLGDLVGDSDVLLSSLANDEAVRATYLGENGVFANLQSGTTILEMSTISPDLSAILHREARKRGASVMDLPVSRSTPAGTTEQLRFLQAVSLRRSIAAFRSSSRSPGSGTSWVRPPRAFV